MPLARQWTIATQATQLLLCLAAPVLAASCTPHVDSATPACRPRSDGMLLHGLQTLRLCPPCRCALSSIVKLCQHLTQAAMQAAR